MSKWGMKMRGSLKFSVTVLNNNIIALYLLDIIDKVIVHNSNINLEPDYESIQIESQRDIYKLNEYAKYYFRYEESLEQRYIEID